ncbi:MAG TPA: RecQ family ATP-dependent DNA helicase, partial [Bacteroidales bacterium]|nr:RecQ family ATP-dependent DNA helicase [Bacteroidales bacterium]
LVKNFAEKISRTLKFELSHGILKTRITEPQKIFESAIGKKDNMKNAFTTEVDVKEKKILLIDDIFDSGSTIKEIAGMLKRRGAELVAPLVIAKTVGGR